MKLGTVTMNYSAQGQPTSASFNPALSLNLNGELLLALKNIKDNKGDVESIKSNSDSVLAQWFNTINEIELADREEYELTSQVIECATYENGSVKYCVIEYNFTRREVG